MISVSRDKSGLQAFVLAQLPRLDYLASYSGRVVQQRGPNSYDVQMDSPDLPGFSGIPVKLPTPGITISLDASQSPRVIVGFANGDPQSPEIRGWELPGLAGLSIVPTGLVQLGGDPATDFVMRGTTYRSAESTLNTAWNAFVTATAAIPGMAAASATMVAALTAFEAGAATYLSAKVKVS